jgi:hypothetical protein
MAIAASASAIGPTTDPEGKLCLSGLPLQISGCLSGTRSARIRFQQRGLRFVLQIEGPIYDRVRHHFSFVRSTPVGYPV